MADPISMAPTQKSHIHIDGFLAADGVTPATVEADPVSGAMVQWELADPVGDSGSLSFAADGMDGFLVANAALPLGDPVRTVTVTGKADANKDPAVQDFITVSQDYVIMPGAKPEPVAASFQVSFGAPEAQ